MTTRTSKDLLDLYRDGDSDAATEIFDRYVERLVALVRTKISSKLARRLDAEDVVQSAYRSFFSNAQNDRYVLQRAGDLWRLLAAIAIHKLQRQVERQTALKRDIHRERESSEDATPLFEAATPEPTAEETTMVVEQLQALMSRIEPPQRQVLEMRLQGHTTEQIADELGRSQRTVRRLLEKSKQSLEASLLDS